MAWVRRSDEPMRLVALPWRYGVTSDAVAEGHLMKACAGLLFPRAQERKARYFTSFRPAIFRRVEIFISIP